MGRPKGRKNGAKQYLREITTLARCVILEAVN
jgi:hypothetical protein